MTREEREKAAQYFKWWKAQLEDTRNKIPKNTVAYNAYQTEISFHDIAIEALEQEFILDKLRAEIEQQEKWLLQAGYKAYNVDIAFDAIKHMIAESEDKE